MNSVERALASLGETLAAKQPEQEPAEKPAKVVQLQIKFHPDAPPAPNDLLRSAFFPAIQSKDRQFINNEVIATLDSATIRLKGEQLNQDDLNTFLAVQTIAQEQPTTLQGRSSERALLKMLGRRRGNNASKALWDSVLRLRSATFILESKRGKYAGGLIDDAYREEGTREYVWRMNPRLNALLNGGATFLALETRQKLAGKPLSQWLQANYASHTTPHAYSVTKLRELSGSKTAALKDFRKMLRRALDDLKAIGEITDWEIDGRDLVCITKAKKISG
jgi:hypothetical protein